MILHVDGGGTPEVPCYFSYYCDYKTTVRQKRQFFSYYPISISRFPFKHLGENLLPNNCSTTDDRGKGTNNLAEYAALYYGIQRFKEVLGCQPIEVFSDSLLIVNQVLGHWQCRKSHLQPWLHAVLDIWWSGIDLKWVAREEIERVLGH